MAHNLRSTGLTSTSHSGQDSDIIFAENKNLLRALAPSSINPQVWKEWGADHYQLKAGQYQRRVPSPNPEPSQVMEELPIELRRAVLQHVNLTSLKNLRLTSTSWAELGEEYLLSPDFNVFACRPDFDRLRLIAEKEKFKYRIQSLHFNHAEVNEYHARHNTYFLQYMRDPETRVETQTSTWHTYMELKEEIESHLQTFSSTDNLEWILSRLPNLRSIEVSLMQCPFPEEHHPDLLKEIWRIPSTRYLPRIATVERFRCLIEAVAACVSIISIKSISHDRLPLEFFARRPMEISLVSAAFQSLTSLNLALDYSDLPNNLHAAQAFQNLSQCIRSATSLQTLELELQGRKKIAIGPLLSSFRAHENVLTSLEKFILKGVLTTEQDLGGFLTNLKSLKIMQLGGEGVKAPHQPANGGVHLEKGTFCGLFETIKEMRLESFILQGDLVGLESGERWVLDIPVNGDDIWEYVMD
jgi:hypothetical protein